MEAHDPGRPLEGAEHHYDAAVLPQVGDGLDTAASEVEVGDSARPDDGEGAVEAFGRQVEEPVAGQRGGGDEEHVLAPEPGG